jgi:flavin reductase (DIM6/NTAB) family NADH-FMN oxidoreductase RutF
LPVQDERFRTIAASLAAGVSIVTAIDAGGVPRGLTSSAVCSVSAVPPAMLVCVDQRSNTLPAIREAGAFAINVLAAGREELALRFASKTEDKFSGVRWTASRAARSAPVLADDVIACAECLVMEEIQAGDHWIFIGSVEDGFVRDDAPLVYCRRTFAAWPLTPAAAGTEP